MPINGVLTASGIVSAIADVYNAINSQDYSGQLDTLITAVDTHRVATGNAINGVKGSLDATNTKLDSLLTKFDDLNLKLTNIKLAVDAVPPQVADVSAGVQLAVDELQTIGARISADEATITDQLDPLAQLPAIRAAVEAMQQAIGDPLAGSIIGQLLALAVGMDKLDTVAARLAADGSTICEGLDDLGELPAIKTALAALEPLLLAMRDRMAPEGESVGDQLADLVEKFTDLLTVLQPGGASAFHKGNAESALAALVAIAEKFLKWFWEATLDVEEKDAAGTPTAWEAWAAKVVQQIFALTFRNERVHLVTPRGNEVVIERGGIDPVGAIEGP